MKRLMLAVSLLLSAALAVPCTAGAAPAKRLNPDGSVPHGWDLEKPDAKAHADDAPPAAGGVGDGANSISFLAFDSGDMIVTQGVGTGHAGVWDDALHTSDYAYCVWSANTTPVNGVQREPAIKYRKYDAAYGLWVPSVSALQRYRALLYSRSHLGQPYNILASKSNQYEWYCSKLAWASYRYITGIDLDADGGYWVWPVDLINDPQTSVFASSM